jgi:integrase
VGIDENRRLHWHSWRRYFVKRCVGAGVSVNVLMEWTGHDTVAMCLEYARTNLNDRFKEFGKVLESGENMGKPKNKPR